MNVGNVGSLLDFILTLQNIRKFILAGNPLNVRNVGKRLDYIDICVCIRKFIMV